MATISGALGNDTITPGVVSPGVSGGAPGNDADSIFGDDGNDRVDGGGGNDTIAGWLGNDTLNGSAGDDSLDGGGGHDTLAGGEGRDTMKGGADDDTYIVDTFGALVVEAPDQGIDRVDTALAAYRLTANVEILTGLASTGQRLVGNALDNIIAGGFGGGALIGGLGRDSLAGSGVDRMLGGADDDYYIVDTVGDVVVEGLNLGLDTVYTTLATYWLAANAENLFGFDNSAQPAIIGIPVMGHRLLGNALSNVITGRDGADTLIGGIGADTLFGSGGADVLNGGLGDDSMSGGADNDAYFVDAAGDLVAEENAAGFDTVVTSLADYTLADHVETLVGKATIGQRLVGNAQDNFIAGSSGADTLEGGEGRDVLLGGAGADLYVVDASDFVQEGLNRGHDTVIAVGGTAHALFENFEVLVLGGTTVTTGTGNAGRNSIIGNMLDNALEGLDGADWLSGDLGADFLSGGGGADTLIGNDGADTLVGEAGADRFRIDTVTDSRPLAADLILDLAFTEGDRIDLRQIDANTLASGDQAFTWIGKAAFAGTGAASAGQLRLTLTAPGQWRAQGDIDGNGLADLQIDITSATGPGAGGWFIL